MRLVCAGGDGDELEALIAAASRYLHRCTDERSLLAINYTSGTTARPKGVMYHHRGAYLQSLAMALHMGLDSDSVYLWTLPMFHCNGWCFPLGRHRRWAACTCACPSSRRRRSGGTCANRASAISARRRRC